MAIAATIIGIIAGIAGVVLAYIFIVPEDKRSKLNGFGKFVHDLANFKFLIIEKILQALYIFLTIFTIVYGFFLLFSVEKVWGQTIWNGWVGLIFMLVGPISVRLMFEFSMMFIILVKNTTQINTKLGPSAPEKKPNYDYRTPTANIENWYCSQCGTQNTADSDFCKNCGNKKA